MIFCKYQFPPEKWATLKPTDETPLACLGHVELPPICKTKDADGNCIEFETTVGVDVMWDQEIDPRFAPYEVFPAPVGIHTFAGCEHLYEQRYQAHLDGVL